MTMNATSLHAVAAWLRLGQRVDAIARLLLLVSLLACIGCVAWPGPASFGWTLVLLGAALAAGLMQVVFAARVQFDADLFAHAAWQATQTDADDARRSLDAALLQLGLLPAAKAGRDWPARVAGARHLLRRQCQWHLAQWLAFAAALCLAVFAHVGT